LTSIDAACWTTTTIVRAAADNDRWDTSAAEIISQLDHYITQNDLHR
jgi:hypothetical protein